MKCFCLVFLIILFSGVISGSILTRRVPAALNLAFPDVQDEGLPDVQCDGLACPAGCCPWGDESYFCCPDMEPVCVPSPEDCW